MRNLTTTKPAGLPSTERRERMAQQARASKAERTWRAYGSDWRIWEAWAAANGTSALPADPERVAEFLSDMTMTRRLSTVRRYLASISVSHTLKGHTFERKHPAIKTILAAPHAGRRWRAGCDPCSPNRSGRSCVILAIALPSSVMRRCWLLALHQAAGAQSSRA